MWLLGTLLCFWQAPWPWEIVYPLWTPLFSCKRWESWSHHALYVCWCYGLHSKTVGSQHLLCSWLAPRPACPVCQSVLGLRFLFMGHIHLFYLPHIAALGGTSGFSPLCTFNRLCGLWPFQYTPDPVNIPGTDPSGQCPGSICLVLLLRPSVSFHLQRP